MKGRKPVPNKLAEVHGYPSRVSRKDREEKAAMEPTSSEMIPAEYFTATQLEIWQEAIAHAPPGILRRIDGWALRAWVVACDLHRQATIAQARTPLLFVPRIAPAVTKKDKDGKEIEIKAEMTGYPQQSPYLAIINRQAIIMLRAAEQMGFTPTSRPRLFASTGPIVPPAKPGPKPKTERSSLSLDDYLANAPPRPNLH